jgi:hypothetical protein
VSSALESVKDVREVLGRYTGAVIAYHELGRGVVCSHRDLDRLAASVLDSIRKQICYHLIDAERIPPTDDGHIGTEKDLRPDGRQLFIEARHDITHQEREIYSFGLELELACRDSRYVEQVCDQF